MSVSALSEFVIPLSTANIQYRPQMVALTNGNYLVSWADGSGRDPDGNILSSSSGFTRFAQVFDANGGRVGSVFMLHPDGVTVNPLAQYPVVPDAGGGFSVYRMSGSSIVIDSYTATGTLSGSTTTNPLTGLPDDPVIVGVTPSDTPGEIIVLTRIDDTEVQDDFWNTELLGYRFYAQVLDQSGTLTGPRVDLGFSISGSAPQVSLIEGRFFALTEVPNTFQDYRITSYDGTTGAQIATATYNLWGNDEPLHVTLSPASDGDRILITSAFWESDPQDWTNALSEGMRVYSLDADTLALTSTDTVATSAVPGTWSATVAQLVPLPFDQFFAIYEDWDQLTGQLLNADMTPVGAAIDLSTQNGLYHVATNGIHVGDGRIAVSWDYSSGADYEDPVTRFFDVTYVGNDLLRGTAEADSILSGDGDDTILAQDGADYVLAGLGNDSIEGGAERDIVYGQKGSDTILGGTGTDVLYGGASRDWISGGDGRDVIGGNRGRDVLAGGAGPDVFVYNFNGLEGQDAITDFEDGIDRIKFKGGSFDQLTIEQNGAHVEVSWTGGAIIIKNTDLSQISSDDFFFV